MAVDLSDEFVKALPDAAIAAGGLVVAWLVGHRVAAYWNIVQKRRELDLAAVQQFYATYGAFFAVWKLWSSFPEKAGRVEAPDDRRRELMTRAADMEGQLETFLVKLAVERRLGKEQKENLARFREGLQCLRESIERGVTLRVRGSEATGLEWQARGGPDGTPGAAYAALKRLAGQVALIATAVPQRRRRHRGEVPDVVVEVTTSARYRTCWWLDPGLAPAGAPVATGSRGGSTKSPLTA